MYGKNRGFAFIRFGTKDEDDQVVQMVDEGYVLAGWKKD